jgi:hypothetical protein
MGMGLLLYPVPGVHGYGVAPLSSSRCAWVWGCSFIQFQVCMGMGLLLYPVPMGLGVTLPGVQGGMV